MDKNYYMCDTNIIITYINRVDQRMIAFIDDPNNVFYYTDTVRDEIPYGVSIPSVFKYHHFRVGKERVDSILNEIKRDFNLTEKGLKKFTNDLTIIIEAGMSCYDATPQGVLKEVFLFSNNLKLYKKFVETDQCRERLEKLINLYGLEHLIEIKRPSDLIGGA
jgi:hypothetical protein